MKGEKRGQLLKQVAQEKCSSPRPAEGPWRQRMQGDPPHPDPGLGDPVQDGSWKGWDGHGFILSPFLTSGK